MKPVHVEIMMRIQDYLENNPHIRFGQALWNLDILEWRNKLDTNVADPFHHPDEEILNRIKDATKEGKKNR